MRFLKVEDKCFVGFVMKMEQTEATKRGNGLAEVKNISFRVFVQNPKNTKVPIRVNRNQTSFASHSL